MDIQEIQVADAAEIQPPLVTGTILSLNGFDQEVTCESICAEGFTSFAGLMPMKGKDIRDLAESYGRRTIGDGRLIFGLCRVWYLIGLIHWVQDFGSIGQEPCIKGIN